MQSWRTVLASAIAAAHLLAQSNCAPRCNDAFEPWDTQPSLKYDLTEDLGRICASRAAIQPDVILVATSHGWGALNTLLARGAPMHVLGARYDTLSHVLSSDTGPSLSILARPETVTYSTVLSGIQDLPIVLLRVYSIAQPTAGILIGGSVVESSSANVMSNTLPLIENIVASEPPLLFDITRGDPFQGSARTLDNSSRKIQVWPDNAPPACYRLDAATNGLTVFVVTDLSRSQLDRKGWQAVLSIGANLTGDMNTGSGATAPVGIEARNLAAIEHDKLAGSKGAGLATDVSSYVAQIATGPSATQVPAAGNDTSLQFNSGGYLAGDSQFLAWDDSNHILTSGAESRWSSNLTQFALRTRSNVITSLPVPYFQPTSSNSAIAFDLMPKGSPGNQLGAGVAWIDVVGQDLSAGGSSSANWQVARLLIGTDAVKIGSYAGGNMTALPLTILGNSITFAQVTTFGSDKSLGYINSAGTFNWGAANQFQVFNTGEIYTQQGLHLSATSQLLWSGTPVSPYGGDDVGLSRLSAGTLQVNSGTAGVPGNLNIKNLTFSGTLIGSVATSTLTGTLSAAQMPALGGDITSLPGSTQAYLIGTGVRPGVYGSSSGVPQLTVDAKGRITDVSIAPITGTTGGAPSGAAGGVLSGTYPNPTLAGVSAGGLLIGGAPGLVSQDPSLTWDSLAKAINLGKELRVDSGQTQFALRSRSNLVTSQPVPYFQPTANNTAIAFDIMPKGNPGNQLATGLAWIDVVAQDLSAGGPTALNWQVGRLAVGSSGVKVGSYAGGNMAALPLTILGNGITFAQVTTTGTDTSIGYLSPTGVLNWGSANQFQIYATGDVYTQQGFHMSPGSQLVWSSSPGSPYGVGDVGIGRDGNSGMRVTNGANGYGYLRMDMPYFMAPSTLGITPVTLGANSPATQSSVPYAWIRARIADGSIVYIPAWR